jgi:N-acetylglutamate synthase-like GNAT family acetyltransferase
VNLVQCNGVLVVGDSDLFYKKYPLRMKIIDISEYIQALPMIAAWHHSEWSDYNPGQTIEMRMEQMQEYLCDDLIPSMFVAMDDHVIGTAALVEHDMETHRELSPWLASVYVDVPSRRKGVASMLVQNVMQQAKHAGIANLYLFTPDRQDLYRRLGWQELSNEIYRGHQVTIMSIDISNDDG